MRPPPVGLPPGVSGAERTGGPGQAEQPDLGVAEAERRGGQGQHHRGEQHGDGGEDEQCESGADPEHGLLGEQREDRADQFRVADPLRAAAFGGDDRGEGDGRGAGGDGGDDVDGAPSGEVADGAGDGPGEEDADHDAAGDDADDAAPVGGVGEGGRVGDHHLGGHGEHADRRHGEQHQRGGGGERHGGERRDGEAELGGDQGAAVEVVAERDEQQQADRVADLGEGADQADRGVVDAEVPGDEVEQRLGVVDVGDGQAAGDGEQPGDGGDGRGTRRDGWDGHGRGAPSRQGGFKVLPRYPRTTRF